MNDETPEFEEKLATALLLGLENQSDYKGRFTSSYAECYKHGSASQTIVMHVKRRCKQNFAVSPAIALTRRHFEEDIKKLFVKSKIFYLSNILWPIIKQIVECL